MRVRTHTNPFNYYYRIKPFELEKIFADFNGLLDYEVGFGKGVFLRNYAKNNPDRNIIGVEVRKNMVEIFKERILDEQLSNLLPVHGNAEICLEDGFQDDQIANIFVFHPDPWFKKKHHKRRVINSKFLKICQKKLKLNGRIYISTDVAGLWEWMQEIFQENECFREVQDIEFWQTYYNSHWHKFSVKENRSIFLGVYELCQK